MNVETTWDRIEAWLKANAKPLRKSLRPPAKPKGVTDLATALGVTLPPDFTASVTRHDGQSGEAESGLFPTSSEELGPEPAWRLLPLSEIREIWQELRELVEMGEFAGRTTTPAPGVRADWWHVGWIPVADNGGGDHVCLDMAPADGGRGGQVLLFSHDSPTRPILAASFAEWLTWLADGMEAGEFTFDPDEGLIELVEDEADED